MDSGGWTRSDAWVLAAILSTAGEDGSCSLADVVAGGDAINHAIMTDVEVEGAVRRLLGAGLIRTRERRFSVTESGQALKDSTRGGLIGQVDHLLAALRRLPVDEHPWRLRPGELDAADRAWQVEARRILARPATSPRRSPKPRRP